MVLESKLEPKQLHFWLLFGDLGCFLISHSDSQQLNVISAFAENTKETTGGNATHLFNHLNPRPSKKNVKKKSRQKGFDELAAANQTQADGRATHIPNGSKIKKKNSCKIIRMNMQDF